MLAVLACELTSAAVSTSYAQYWGHISLQPIKGSGIRQCCRRKGLRDQLLHSRGSLALLRPRRRSLATGLGFPAPLARRAANAALGGAEDAGAGLPSEHRHAAHGLGARGPRLRVPGSGAWRPLLRPTAARPPAAYSKGVEIHY